MIDRLIDLDMPEGTPARQREVTPDQSELIADMLDTDCGWDSAMVRITWIDEHTVEMTRVDTYRRNPGEVYPS